MPLLSLPTEIMLQILPLLDYDGFRSLTQTNRFLRSLASDKLVREVLMHTEKNHPAIFLSRGALPCYVCLRVKKKQEFPTMHEMSIFRLGRPRVRERTCYDCGEKLGCRFHSVLFKNFLRSYFEQG